jgi:hypothetical protein
MATSLKRILARELQAYEKLGREGSDPIEKCRDAIMHVAEELSDPSAAQLSAMQEQLEALDALEHGRSEIAKLLRAAADEFAERAGTLLREHGERLAEEARAAAEKVAEEGADGAAPAAPSAAQADMAYPEFSFREYVAERSAGSAAGGAADGGGASSASVAPAAAAVPPSARTREFMRTYGGGEDLNGDGDVVAVGGNAPMNAKCPISQKAIVEVSDPVRNTTCGHLYSRTAIEGYIAQQQLMQQRRGRTQVASCPVAGCNGHVAKKQLKEAKDVLRQQKRGKKRQRTDGRKSPKAEVF